MLYYVKSRKPLKVLPRVKLKKRLYHKEPTLSQIAQRDKVVHLAKSLRGLGLERVLNVFADMGYYPTEKRIYKSGGVGSWCWLPKFGVFRVQVRASHISSMSAFMPYALCVEV